MTTEAHWKAIEDRWRRLSAIKKSVAQGIGTGVVSCGLCKKSEAVNIKSVADYLSWGWPKCCHATMTFTPDNPTNNP